MDAGPPTTPPIDPPTSNDQPEPGSSSPLTQGRGRVIPATCELHHGPVGYANLLVSRSGGTIVLDPHAVGCCVIRLDEAGAGALRDLLSEWLG